MSRKGCSPDNAACEGFFGRLKMELFYPGNWQSTTIGQFIEAVDTCILWYNEKTYRGISGTFKPCGIWKDCERLLNASLQFVHLAFWVLLLKRL